MKKLITLILMVVLCTLLTACSGKKEKVVIYTSAADYRIAHMNDSLTKAFPDYDITVEFLPSGKHAAKIMAEGTKTECDIIYDLPYLSLDELAKAGILADLSNYDTSIYTDDTVVSKNYHIELRMGGAIIVNTDVLKERSLPVPKSYDDLLKPEYKGLVSMSDPRASGTGYMFLKSLVNAWGEKKAFEYFDKLSVNISQFKASGAAPVNALAQKEVAIALGITNNAVIKINEGIPLDIIFFEEGSPYSLYGQSIIKGKDKRQSVKNVFDYMVSTLNVSNCKLFAPEKIYKDKDFEIKNFPTNIKYADMSNDTLSEKKRLLDKWKY